MGLMHSDALQCFLANLVKKGRLLQHSFWGQGVCAAVTAGGRAKEKGTRTWHHTNEC